MAIVTFPGGLYIPPYPAAASALWVMATISNMNAITHKYAINFAAPKAGTLETAVVLFGAVAASATHRVSFQTLNATGAPDGTVDQYKTFTPTIAVPYANIITPITSDGTGGGTRRTVTRGERLALVVDFSAYTSGITQVYNYNITPHHTAHILTTTDGTTWAKNISYTPTFAIGYDDGTYAPISPAGVRPAYGTEVTFNSATGTFDERGLRFTVPAPLRLSGVWWTMRYASGSHPTFDVVLYEGSTELVADSIDGVSAFMTSTGTRYAFHRFSVDTDLVPSTVYRITLRPTTTVNVTLNEYQFASAAIRGAWDGGLNMQRTARLNLGSWTDTDTYLYDMGLYVTGIDDGTGAGADAASGGRLNRGWN